MVLQAALGAKGPEFTGKEFGWVGAPSDGIPSCTIMGFTGFKTWQEVVASGKEIKMGATAVGSTTGDLPLILRAATPAKIKLVEGYDGTAEIRRAMLAKEVDGMCWGWESASTTGKAMLEASGDDQLIPVLIEGKHDSPHLKDVEQLTSAIKDPDHLSAYNAWLGPYEFQRPIMLPPKTPEHIVAAWREAFNKTMQDKEFLEEVKKADLYLKPVNGEQVDKSVEKVWSITPKAKEFLEKTITAGAASK
jgi:tripartite-type tricarboxylate transporter receptor subunit TctC